MLERREVSLPVAEVTVLEDRAHVVRRGRVALASGLVRLVVRGASPLLADKTLAARARDGSARVTDARARRAVVEVADEGAAAKIGRELEARFDALSRELEAAQSEANTCRVAVAAHEALLAQTLRELAEDSGWGRAPGAEATRELDAVRAAWHASLEAAEGASERVRELAAERERLRERLTRLRALRAEGTPDAPLSERAVGARSVSGLCEREAATLELDVHSEGAGEVELEVSYLVPSACWRPYHSARLLPGAAPAAHAGAAAPDAAAAPSAGAEHALVQFRSDACVWQHTGEDWLDVDLAFSTERASLGIDPPELASDVLRVQRKRETFEVERREQALETTGLGADSGTELPGIEDGGEPLRLRARVRASVPSDGRPHRVPLFEASTEAEVERVAMPELSPCVFLKSVQAHRGTVPILAGPVDLLQASGFVGRTRVLFVAPGERFALGWGPDPELRIKRTLNDKPAKAQGVLGSWRSREVEIELRMSNLAASARRVRVTERVPVSEVEKVKIEIDATRTSACAASDEDGFVHFALELRPYGREKLTLAYAVRTHEDVVGL